MDHTQKAVVHIPGSQQTFLQSLYFYIISAVFIVCAISPFGWLYWMLKPVFWRPPYISACYRLLSAIIAVMAIVFLPLPKRETIDILALARSSMPLMVLCILAWLASGIAACDNVWHTLYSQHLTLSLKRVWVRILVYTCGCIGYCIAAVPYTIAIWYPSLAFLYRLLSSLARIVTT